MTTLTITGKTYHPTPKKVFDIQVENTEHYVLENGLLSHNSGVVYAASIVVAMQKRKLKEDTDGNKVSEVTGIRSAVKVMKSRYAKPFETMEIKIPYEQGMDPYSGLTDLFESKGFLVKEGNKLAFTDSDGVVTKEFRKYFDRNQNGVLDRMMVDFMAKQSKTAETVEGVGLDHSADEVKE